MDEIIVLGFFAWLAKFFWHLIKNAEFRPRRQLQGGLKWPPPRVRRSTTYGARLGRRHARGTDYSGNDWGW